ncbi:hypothetical protein B0A58_06535 [Flavobacterium branchiophilum NBRC 15030 = ATCC 35035]|uniref:Uncharacterized protein n=1 Tax=Flavobacterium branchiophilum TaxID=55197 RepID=A0A543G823_9FLAO|nr:hypothetical protein [Flavobacterium branchiophilum]OXA76911.1 hypothetical protein B0A58_06535 [Flavobacterium branchiophilum NBRC 15030 = ATCC 35035]TQM42231.1 hypothetical protein BC670_3271 [Flavobacterium branchiophilum]GEM54317.1 hypothetical protein FB1_05380 [Flavobacterium branchiophilum NBRC 15030 = ATCC 35035]
MSHTLSCIICQKTLNKSTIEQVLNCQLRSIENAFASWVAETGTLLHIKTRKGTFLIKPFEHTLVKNPIKDEIIEFSCCEASDEFYLYQYKNYKTVLEYESFQGEENIRGSIFWDDYILDAIWDLLDTFCGEDLSDSIDEWEFEAYEILDEKEGVRKNDVSEEVLSQTDENCSPEEFIEAMKITIKLFRENKLPDAFIKQKLEEMIRNYYGCLDNEAINIMQMILNNSELKS